MSSTASAMHAPCQRDVLWGFPILFYESSVCDAPAPSEMGDEYVEAWHRRWNSSLYTVATGRATLATLYSTFIVGSYCTCVHCIVGIPRQVVRDRDVFRGEATTNILVEEDLR
eukprot:COSAG02_NODE_6540_length_3508_cov_3.305075_2_plen_113_part_00